MVLPKTTPDQRAPLYEDVESLLNYGFLTHHIEANGVALEVRSLSPGDLFLLKTRVGRRGDYHWQMWTIASSIWMIDGYLTLGDPQATAFLYHKVKNLPRNAREILFSVIIGLHNRQTKAISATEAYCFESTSRFRWQAFHNSPLNSNTGIPGAERLGLNHVQQMWAAFNEMEDRRHEEETAWEGVKFVASAQSPKGVKKVDETDQRRRGSEDARRQGIQDKFYYTAVGLIGDDGKAPDGFPQRVSQTKTVEELEEEMFNWVSGKEDWHDRTVREYKESIVAKYEAEKAEAAERAQVMWDAYEEESAEPPVLIGYSPAQLNEILKERGEGRPGVSRIIDSDRRDSVYRKYIVRPPDAGRLVPTTDGKLGVAPADPTEEGPRIPDMEY